MSETISWMYSRGFRVFEEDYYEDER